MAKKLKKKVATYTVTITLTRHLAEDLDSASCNDWYAEDATCTQARAALIRQATEEIRACINDEMLGGVPASVTVTLDDVVGLDSLLREGKHAS